MIVYITQLLTKEVEPYISHLPGYARVYHRLPLTRVTLRVCIYRSGEVIADRATLALGKTKEAVRPWLCSDAAVYVSVALALGGSLIPVDKPGRYVQRLVA